jgi:predicted nucleic acid-binding Zn ribbon protein
MAMTDEEILSAAGRLRAAKRRRVAKTCPVCGTPFEGVAQRRYCSAACRVRASRGREDEAMAQEWAKEIGVATASATRPALRDAVSASSAVAGAATNGASVARWEDGNAPLAPRGAAESLDDYLARAAAYLASGGALVPRGDIDPGVGRFWWPRPMPGEEDDDDSLTLIREGREMRTAQLERAIGTANELDIEPPAPRGEGEPLLDYLERVSAFLMAGEVFEDDSAKLVRQSRRERTLELERATGLIRDDR